MRSVLKKRGFFLILFFMRKTRFRTFIAIIVPDGICSTLTTLPPLPCPSSDNFFRSEFLRSSLGTSAFKSSFAKVFDKVLCIALRRPVIGLSGVGSSSNPFDWAPSTRGGGRFLGIPGRGAGLEAIGSDTRTMGSSRARDLKFLFVRRGVEGAKVGPGFNDMLSEERTRQRSFYLRKGSTFSADLGVATVTASVSNLTRLVTNSHAMQVHRITDRSKRADLL